MRRIETSMPYDAEVDRFYVYLVWGIRDIGEHPELIAIATTAKARDRYLKMGRNERFMAVRSERAWLDHRYGESLLPAEDE